MKVRTTTGTQILHKARSAGHRQNLCSLNLTLRESVTPVRYRAASPASALCSVAVLLGRAQGHATVLSQINITSKDVSPVECQTVKFDRERFQRVREPQAHDTRISSEDSWTADENSVKSRNCIVLFPPNNYALV